MKRIPADHDDFEKYLAHSTSSELILNRGDLPRTKNAFIGYFHRGIEAGITLPRLMEMLPSIILMVDYTTEEGQRVVMMLKDLTIEELGTSPDDSKYE